MQGQNTPTPAKPVQKHDLCCVICNTPTSRLVDGELSCDRHANLVYENQLEDYTKLHMR